MKAIAKHDCSVTLTTSLESLSLNRMGVRKGQEIEFPVYEDKELPDGEIADVLGKRSVVFQDGIMLIPTYSKDFDYV